MLKRFQRVSMFPALLFCLFLILLTACSGTPTTSGTQATSTPTGSKNTPTSSATATNGTQGNNGGSSGMPQTTTSCPAANTARAAVMRPLALGSHQNLVYIYNDVPANTSTSSGVLRRYDTTTGQKVNIATSGLRIDQAQISRDGQWVLFLSIPDPRGDSQHSAMLQLVRMDGQGLQTLYCFPNVTYSGHSNSSRLPISIQWSEDQKSLLVSVNTNNNTSQIFLIDVASGSIRQLFLDQNDSLYSYSVVTWLDYTHFYIIKQGNSAPTPPATVFLLDANTATVTNPGLVNILTTDTRMSYFSLDSSPDGRQLYNSNCLLAASPFNTTIKVGPATGGARTTFFQGTPQDCVQVLRVISPTKLLMLAQVATEAGNAYANDVLTMNTTPGASENVLTILSVSSSEQTRYDMNETTQFSWSNVSRDGNSYALQEADPSANTQSILIGSLSGGNTHVIAITNSGLSAVSLAGWTTM